MTFEVHVNESLARFVSARLDEVEETASFAGPARIAWLTYPDEPERPYYTTVAAGDDYSPWTADGRDLPQPASARVVYDPERVRADIQVWRRLLVEYRSLGLDAKFAGTERETGFHLALSAALKFKAATWADHQDYRPAWEEA